METYFIKLALGQEGREPPSEIRIFPRGKFRTKKGDFLYDEQSRDKVLAEWQEHGADKFIDYRHQALDSFGPPEGGKAAAWFELEDRDGELWATNVRWTPAADAALRAGEWKYLSPAFVAERESKRITELVNVALTNLPATVKQTPLVAAQKDLFGSEESIMKEVAVALGASGDLPDAELLARIARHREAAGELCKLTSKDSLAMALAEVAGWKEAALRLSSLEAENAKLRAREQEARIDAKVAEGLVKPADRDRFVRLSVEAPALFDEWIESLTTPVIPVAANVRTMPRPAAKGIDTVSDDELATFGLTRDVYEKTQQAINARGRR